VVGQIIAAEPLVGNHWGDPYIGDRFHDRAKCARSEEASSISGNIHLAEGDASQRITQNCQQQECGLDLADLCNIIDDRRCHRARMSSP
jgi:hypothetical protein